MREQLLVHGFGAFKLEAPLASPDPFPTAEGGLDTETKVFLHKFKKVRGGWRENGRFGIVVVVSEVITKSFYWEGMTAEPAVCCNLVLLGGNVVTFAQMCKV